MTTPSERERAAQYKIWRDGYPDTYDGHGHVHPPRELPEWAIKFSDTCAEAARREERWAEEGLDENYCIVGISDF